MILFFWPKNFCFISMMLILLFDSVCLLVFIASFMGEDSVSYSYTYRLFMQSTPFSNYFIFNVPTTRLLDEHRATPTFKALASTRQCTNQQVRKIICYSDQSQSRRKLLYRLQAPHSQCVFSIKSKKRVTRPPKQIDIPLDDDTEFDELRVVRQNAATHMSLQKEKNAKRRVPQ